MLVSSRSRKWAIKTGELLYRYLCLPLSLSWHLNYTQKDRVNMKVQHVNKELNKTFLLEKDSHWKLSVRKEIFSGPILHENMICLDFKTLIFPHFVKIMVLNKIEM